MGFVDFVTRDFMLPIVRLKDFRDPGLYETAINMSSMKMLGP